MKIVFAGTPTFAEVQLHALLEAKHEIVAVYTQPDKPAGRGQHLHESPVKTLALKHNIPVEQPHSLKNPDAHDILKQYSPDVMIVAAYGLILPQNILNIPSFGCINVHASLLPRWRGASPIQQAILAGDVETGITLMQMDAGLDTGDILAQKECVISSDDTAQSLHDKLAHVGAKLLVKKLHEITHSPHPQKQDAKIATIAPKITKEQAHLRWDVPAIEIERKIRAFNPWPIAFSHIGVESVRLFASKVIPGIVEDDYGTIVSHTPIGIVVATSQELLLLTHGQLPGKKALPFSEILKGHHQLFAIGQRLG